MTVLLSALLVAMLLAHCEDCMRPHAPGGLGGGGGGAAPRESETLLNLNPLLKRLTALRHNVSCHLCSVMDIKGLLLFPHNKPPFSEQISITK